MAEFRDIHEAIRSSLDRENELRENAYQASRQLTIISRNQISRIVRGESPGDEKDLDGARDLILDIRGKGEALRHAFIDDSLSECAEAKILARIVNDNRLPTPEEIKITERDYILGAGDVIGEMRRMALNSLLGDDIDSAKGYMDWMRELYTLMEDLVYPSGLLPIKRKRDVARSLIDRTSGEIAIASATSRYETGGDP